MNVCRWSEHCFVWTKNKRHLVIACAHCATVASESDLSMTYSEDLLATKADESQVEHYLRCQRPSLF